jgi:type I restriction enzyme M protein
MQVSRTLGLALKKMPPLWAMTLKIVRDQWRRVVFMQTNREDVGKRWLEIEVPVPESREVADRVSEPFRTYYKVIASGREALAAYLRESDDHHFFVSGAEMPEPEALAVLAEGEELLVVEGAADS